MIEQIKNSDIEAKKVANLPSHPNAPKAMGGGGFTAQELKERYDALALLAIEKLNELISRLTRTLGEGNLADEILTEISGQDGELYTVSQVFSHITDGTLATYLSVGEKSLDAAIDELTTRREVYNITNIDDGWVIDKPENLPADAKNGAVLLVTSEESLYTYSEADKAWLFKVRLEPHTLYCVLEGEKSGIYRFTNDGTTPTPNFLLAEQAAIEKANQYTDRKIENDLLAMKQEIIQKTEAEIGEVSAALESVEKAAIEESRMYIDQEVDKIPNEVCVGTGKMPDGAVVQFVIKEEGTSNDRVIAKILKSLLKTETWTFTLEDGSTVTKVVYVE